MPQHHLLKGKLFFLTVCFSHAIIQCISHVMLITVEGKKIMSGAEKQEGNDKAVT